MKLYLDSVVAIYLVEQPTGFGTIAGAAIARLMPTALDGTDLLRMECLIHPRRLNDAIRESDFERSFQQNYSPFQSMDAAVFERATVLRAKYWRLKTSDALHLSAAIVSGCDAFVTNDVRLKVVTEIGIEVI